MRWKFVRWRKLGGKARKEVIEVRGLSGSGNCLRCPDSGKSVRSVEVASTSAFLRLPTPPYIPSTAHISSSIKSSQGAWSSGKTLALYLRSVAKKSGSGYKVQDQARRQSPKTQSKIQDSGP